MKWDMEIDVLVIGAGGCGLVAALAAYEQGVEVAILEKLSSVGGNSSLSSGSIPGAGTRFQREAGIEDSPEKMYEDLLQQSGHHDADELTRILSYESAYLVEWLVDKMEVDLKLITDYKHVGHSVNRLHAPASRQGKDLIKDLVKAVEKRGIPIAVSNPVTQLILDEQGEIIGVQVSNNGEQSDIKIKAQKIILASNGFGANRQLLHKYCADIATAPYFGATGSTGEAMIWGESLNAQFSNIGSYQGYAAVSAVLGTLMSWTTIEKGGIIINSKGSRFGNESDGYSGFAKDVLAQGEYAFAIFNKEIRDYVMSNEKEFRELVLQDGVKEADSIEQLAELYHLDSKCLKDTILNYNLAVVGEQEDEFGRKDFGFAPLEAPFIICKIVPGLFHTQGGLKVDQCGRVIDKNNQVIKNLFAGGGAAGGVSGKNGGNGYSSGNGLLSALGLGRIAGAEAAKEALLEKTIKNI